MGMHMSHMCVGACLSLPYNRWKPCSHKVCQLSIHGCWQGALQHTEEVEVQHWMRLACCRTMALAQQALHGLVNSHSQKPAGQQAPIQVIQLANIAVFAIKHLNTRHQRGLLSSCAGDNKDADILLVIICSTVLHAWFVALELPHIYRFAPCDQWNKLLTQQRQFVCANVHCLWVIASCTIHNI